MPSPEWSYGVLLRRALIAAIGGDHATARALVEQSRPLGDRVLWPDEALGLDLGARTLIQRITGVTDPALPALHDEFAAMPTIPPKAFFQSHVAASALAAGDRDTAEQMVHRLAGRLTRVETPAEAPATILLVAALVARLGLREHAGALRRLCEPFRGYLTTELGFAVDQPTDLTLAELALIMGDDDDALAFVDAALEQARAMPSPCYEATSLWLRSRIERIRGRPEAATADRRQAEAVARRVGAILPDAEPDGAPVGVAAGERAGGRRRRPSQASLARAGATWTITSPLGDGVVAHSVGSVSWRGPCWRRHRARCRPSTSSPPTARRWSPHWGPRLDTVAKHAYRRRIAELQAEIDEADGFHDPERAELARRELDALMQELRRAVGLRGRDRPVGSGAERARVNVARSLRRAIQARHPPGRARPGRPPRGVGPHRPGLRLRPRPCRPARVGGAAGLTEHRRRNIVP